MWLPDLRPVGHNECVPSTSWRCSQSLKIDTESLRSTLTAPLPNLGSQTCRRITGTDYRSGRWKLLGNWCPCFLSQTGSLSRETSRFHNPEGLRWNFSRSTFTNFTVNFQSGDHVMSNISALVNIGWFLSNSLTTSSRRVQGVPFDDTIDWHLDVIVRSGRAVLGNGLLGTQIGNESDSFTCHHINGSEVHSAFISPGRYSTCT